MDFKTLDSIRTNKNTGVEYEIALFYRLLNTDQDMADVKGAISQRGDAKKIFSIAQKTDVGVIMRELVKRGLFLQNVVFATQDDTVGPSDIIMHLRDTRGDATQVGISVKYNNTCTLNVTGSKFLTDAQKAKLENKLHDTVVLFVDEKKHLYGNAQNWFRDRSRSRSGITDDFIDQIRNEVIVAWGDKSKDERREIIRLLYQAKSPIDYWVYEYTAKGCNLDIAPVKLTDDEACAVTLGKHQTSYISFILRSKVVGLMQVKFNNGILEKCKKRIPDIVVDGIRMSYGRPFSSWNFSLVNY